MTRERGGKCSAVQVKDVSQSQAVTVGVHGEEKKKRLHVLTALVLFFLLLKTTCADSPRSSAPFLVEQLRNRTSCTPSVTACFIEVRISKAPSALRQSGSREKPGVAFWSGRVPPQTLPCFCVGLPSQRSRLRTVQPKCAFPNVCIKTTNGVDWILTNFCSGQGD